MSKREEPGFTRKLKIKENTMKLKRISYKRWIELNTALACTARRLNKHKRTDGVGFHLSTVCVPLSIDSPGSGRWFRKCTCDIIEHFSARPCTEIKVGDRVLCLAARFNTRHGKYTYWICSHPVGMCPHKRRASELSL